MDNVCKPALCVPSNYAQLIRKILQSKELYDPTRRSRYHGNCHVALPISDAEGTLIEQLLKDLELDNGFTWEVKRLDLPPSKKKLCLSHYEKLVSAVESFMSQHSIAITDELRSEIPKHWERHEDLVLLPNCFQSDVWRKNGSLLWELVLETLSGKRLAMKGCVEDNGFRSPRVDLLLGVSGWVTHLDNGIKYSYDVTRCMFSSGNITEKLRIANFDCKNEVVLDLYAGIGYFTLPYLVHANASHVHACEWNPDAVEALKKNLRLNGVEDRCTIHFGDNRKTYLTDIADRVNLGLIPSSEPGWLVACTALKKCSGGILHIHGNVESKESSSIDLEKSCNATAKCDREGRIIFEDFESHYTEVQTDDTEEVDKISCNPQNLTAAELLKFPKKRQFEQNKKKKIKTEWTVWAQNVSAKMESYLNSLHEPQTWRTTIQHIEHIKSYAPHVHHLVLDLKCEPNNN